MLAEMWNKRLLQYCSIPCVSNNQKGDNYMRKKVLSVILMIGLVASMIGCGSSEQEKTAVNVSAEPTESEEVENEAVKTVYGSIM